jgi:predicted DNA repair protein MutK
MAGSDFRSDPFNGRQEESVPDLIITDFDCGQFTIAPGQILGFAVVSTERFGVFTYLVFERVLRPREGCANARRPHTPASAPAVPTDPGRLIPAHATDQTARSPVFEAVPDDPGGSVSLGLIALLDDVAFLARTAAASLDDVAGQAARAGTKAAGVVIDDAAVTPRYVTGFAAERELPIVGKIALGSLRNKLLFLLPGALALSAFAPWAITPLLMLGGAYLCFEGTEKVYEALFPHKAHGDEDEAEGGTDQAREDRRVASAIKTDFILSAEIMAITLAALPEGSVWMRAVVLAIVAVGITAAVYGAVAIIVKADDAGLAMARSQASPPLGSLLRGLGRGIVKGMPILLNILSVVGTAAMVWVGGGILLHGLEEYGIAGPAHATHEVAASAAALLPAAKGFIEWLVTAAVSGVLGLIVGGLLIPVTSFVIAPLWRSVAGGKAKPA